jgi:CheY-like chemotaxis protein
MLGGPLVLLVDDDESTLEVTRVILEDEGYDVETAANGRAALDRLRLEPTPSLLLVDLMMPHVDGYAVLRELEHGEKPHPEVAVVVMTASGPNEKSSGLPYPVLRKPFTIEELLSVITHYAPRLWDEDEPTTNV